MHEKFLHFIWQCQEFNKSDLLTCQGEPLVILSPGILNTNEGPDFSQGRVKIGNLEWHGAIEIHIKSSEWHRHGHDQHPAYQQVVLHVVWKNDRPVLQKNGEPIPALELKDRVDHNILYKYQRLVKEKAEVPCAKSLSQVPGIVRLSMLDAVLVERMEKKSHLILDHLRSSHNDWDISTCRMLIANFGFKTNQVAFTELSRRLPISIICRLSTLEQVEALVFGISGLLQGKSDDPYFTKLQAEYQYLKAKFQLEIQEINPGIWKFLRLRPSNFPTLRLAQLSALLYRNQRFFTVLKESEDLTGLLKSLEADQSQYWQQHYNFGLVSTNAINGLGRQSREILVINLVVPVLIAYARAMDLPQYQEKALTLLQHLPSENNRIIRAWRDLGFKVDTAFDSQALIGLFNDYCQRRNCLSCKIGASIIKNVPGLLNRAP